MERARAELAYFDADALTGQLRATLRAMRDSFTKHTGDLPEADVIAGGLFLALRGRVTDPRALAAMFLGIQTLADEVIREARN